MTDAIKTALDAAHDVVIDRGRNSISELRAALPAAREALERLKKIADMFVAQEVYFEGATGAAPKWEPPAEQPPAPTTDLPTSKEPIQDWEWLCSNKGATDLSDCPRCEGTGRYQKLPWHPLDREYDCAICEGTGKIDHDGEPAKIPKTGSRLSMGPVHFFDGDTSLCGMGGPDYRQNRIAANVTCPDCKAKLSPPAPTTAKLLAEYTAVFNKFGIASDEEIEFIERHSDNKEFVSLAATARCLKLALLSPPAPTTDNPDWEELCKEEAHLRDKAEADLAALRAERDALQRQCDDADLLMGDGWQDVVAIATGTAGVETALRSQLAKLSGDVAERDDRIATLRAALKPFAEAATWFEQLMADPPWKSDKELHPHTPGETDDVPVKYTDCVAARSALAKEPA